MTIIYLNPQSGRGRAQEIFATVRESIESRFKNTKILSSLAELASACVKPELENVIVIGGDGTIHQVVNILVENRPDHLPIVTIGILSAGTGCDFSRSLNDEKSGQRSLESEIKRIMKNQPRPLDVGAVRFANGEIHHYVNSASIGMGGYTCRLINQWHKSRLPPAFSYFIPGFKSVFGYKGEPMRIEYENQVIYEGQTWGVMVYNGRFSGGGKCWAPAAEVNDGQLDVLIMPPFSKFRLPSALIKLFTGKINEFKKFIPKQLPIVTVKATNNTLLPIELDGECFDSIAYYFSVIPNKLNVW